MSKKSKGQSNDEKTSKVSLNVRITSDLKEQIKLRAAEHQTDMTNFLLPYLQHAIDRSDNTEPTQNDGLTQRVEFLENALTDLESLKQVRRDLYGLAHLILSQIPLPKGSDESPDQRATRLLSEVLPNDPRTKGVGKA